MTHYFTLLEWFSSLFIKGRYNFYDMHVFCLTGMLEQRRDFLVSLLSTISLAKQYMEKCTQNNFVYFYLYIGIILQPYN